MPAERRAHAPLADASNASELARDRAALSASKKSAREKARPERSSGPLDASPLAAPRASVEGASSSVEDVVEAVQRRGASRESDARRLERGEEG